MAISKKKLFTWLKYLDFNLSYQCSQIFFYSHTIINIIQIKLKINGIVGLFNNQYLRQFWKFQIS